MTNQKLMYLTSRSNEQIIQILSWKLLSLISASKRSNELDNLMLYDLMAGLYRFIPFFWFCLFDIDGIHSIT